jgi:hypothetical protein
MLKHVPKKAAWGNYILASMLWTVSMLNSPHWAASLPRCGVLKKTIPSWAVGDGGEEFPFVVSSSQAVSGGGQLPA